MIRHALMVGSLLVVAVSCRDDSTTTVDPSLRLALSGGDATVFSEGRQAFSLSLPSLTNTQTRAFAVGNNFFNDNWVTAPASTAGRDGLGPLFNAQACSSCHAFDGRAAPPLDDDDPERGLLLRLSIPLPDGSTAPEPTYGGQLQDRAINGVSPEGRIEIDWTVVPGEFADGTPFELTAPTYRIVDLGYGPLADDVLISPRIAPAVFGVGLLEAVPGAVIESLADPDDTDGDGISGRVNWLPGTDGSMVVGRFGWKANVATVRQQNAGAFHGDIGITSSVHPDQDCTPAEPDCAAALGGGEPEVDDAKLDRVTFYTRTLAVPARRSVGDPNTDAGERLFGSIGCSACHTPTLTTGDSDVPALSNQTIRPYTDLLIHDMGPALADERPDGSASGSEWRTAPLWGIGLVDDVNGHTRFLHDGRARSLVEAIVWHGGEAQASRDGFAELSESDRRALVAFLESL
jgi:CxxC motif-containing protein (DUF1111 family)